MWMKPLSLFTFSIFLLMLGINLYSSQSDRFDKITSAQEEHQSLFEMEPEKARALLDDLDVYVKKDKAIKKAKKFAKKNRTRSKKNKKRILASKPVQKKENVSQFLKDKYQKLEEAFLAREDNLLEIRFMQDEVRRMKEDKEVEQGNIEVWSTEFIFLLMIQERLGFEEIIGIKNPSDIGLETDEWLTLKAQAETDDFKLRILKFKGIETDEEAEEVLAEDEQDFEPTRNREQALKNFDQRNQDSREGYAEDARDAQEISFSDNDSDSYDEEESEYYRQPTSLEEDENNENEYEY